MHTNKANSCRCTHNHLKIFLEILNINVTSNDLFMICKENILMMHYHAIFHVVDISVAIKNASKILRQDSYNEIYKYNFLLVISLIY